MKNWNACIIVSIVCRLLGVISILAFVYAMVVYTGSLKCLWLLFLLLAVELIPVYEFKHKDEGKDLND